MTPKDIHKKLASIKMEHLDPYDIQAIADDLSIFLEKRSPSTRVFVDPKTFYDTQEIRTKTGKAKSYKRFRYLYGVAGDPGVFTEIKETS